MGKIKEILETKANDVLVIEPTKESIDKNERLVPYIKDEIVKQINIAENTILIDWPEDFDMHFNLITIFPELVENYVSHGIIANAIEKETVDNDLEPKRI